MSWLSLIKSRRVLVSFLMNLEQLFRHVVLQYLVFIYAVDDSAPVISEAEGDEVTEDETDSNEDVEAEAEDLGKVLVYY